MFLIISKVFITVSAVMMLASCGSGRMHICGNDSLEIPYKDGVLTITIVHNGVNWRVINKFSNKAVKVNMRNFHMTNEGWPLSIRPMNEWNHPIFKEGEIQTKQHVLYYDVYKENYIPGDKIEIIIDKNYVEGADYVHCLVTD